MLRTDRNGSIVVTTDGQTYEVRTNSVVYFPSVIRMLTPTPTSAPMSQAGEEGMRGYDHV